VKDVKVDTDLKVEGAVFAHGLKVSLLVHVKKIEQNIHMLR